MTNNFYTIRKTAEFLNHTMKSSVILECFTQEKGKLVIMLKRKDEDVALEFSALKEMPYLILRRNFSKAGRNAAPLFEELWGTVVENAAIVNDDRALRIELTGGQNLCFGFFAAPNCFVLMEDIITDAFKDKASFEGKKLEEIFVRKAADNKQQEVLTAAAYLMQKFPHFGEIYRREVLSRSSVDKNTAADGAIKNVLDESAEDIIGEFDSGKFLLYETSEGLIMSLAILTHLQLQPSKVFENINSLVSTYAFSSHRKKKETELRKSKLASLNKSLREAERKRVSIETQLEQCRNSTFFQKCGELILSNIGIISKGQTLLQTVDEAGTNIDIKLKPELTAPQNAATFFEKGKKQKASVQLLSKKLLKINHDICLIQSEIDKFTSSENLKELEKEFRKEKKMEKDETQRFRKFKVEGDYEVWVGKDSAANDLLTTRHAAQNDLWFHVRGSSGSHTVLKVSNKKEQIPKEAITAAASIAAYYSKSRNAGNVPVAYCEKKYVKKKKGFKEGTVVMEKEKVVFVKPKLPEEKGD
jgi:predicted ribosome quality control (RQC) complex YloA/Tae2 family protein